MLDTAWNYNPLNTFLYLFFFFRYEDDLLFLNENIFTNARSLGFHYGYLERRLNFFFYYFDNIQIDGVKNMQKGSLYASKLRLNNLSNFVSFDFTQSLIYLCLPLC